MPRVSARDLERLRNGGRATSIKIQPTGTAVDQYQVPLGQRHDARPVGVAGAPSWSDSATQTETWTKIPRLSATCPRKIVAFSGGRNEIDRTFEFGDDFSGDLSKWTGSGIDIAQGQGIGGSPAVRVKGSMYASVPLPSRFAIEVDVNPQTSGNGFYGLISGNGSGEMQTIFGYPTSVIGYRTNTVPNWFSAQSYTTGTWYRLKLVYDAITNAAAPWNFYVNGVVRAQNQVPYGGNITPTQVKASGDATYWGYIDLVRVCKYSPNEPIAGTVRPSTTNRALCRPLSASEATRCCCTGA